MSSKEIWFITGSGRGMGTDFARAALAAGHAVVGTGRNSSTVSKALGQSNDLLAVKLDVTSRSDADAAVRAAVDRFGRIFDDASISVITTDTVSEIGRLAGRTRGHPTVSSEYR